MHKHARKLCYTIKKQIAVQAVQKDLRLANFLKRLLSAEVSFVNSN